MAKNNPNQKFITVNKAQCDHLYAKINLDALNHAAVDLKAGAFKLWIYMSKNQSGYSFGLSSSDAQNSFGIGKSQYDTAVAELIDKGYLVLVEGQHYMFYEFPLQENNTTKTVIRKSNNEISLSENQITKKDFVVGKQYNEDVSLQENNTTSLFENQTTVVGKSSASLFENHTRNITYTTQIPQEDITELTYSDVLRMFEEGTYRIENGMCYRNDGKAYKIKFDF